ncbi:RpiR family transcriptional regulator, partial [Lactobacillus salivarius]|nr:RpiR family transcriptional regulator [Ligilactobacillus salivarius]
STWSAVVKNSNFVDNTRFINSQLAIVYVIDIITMELMEKSEYSSTMNKTVELIMDRKLSK